MAELVDDVGYDAVTVQALSRRAGVSTGAFYKCFKGKQECLLSSYEDFMQRTARRVSGAHRGESEWNRRLQLSVGAFARQLVDEPEAARLALVEVASAGLALFGPMQQVAATFEAMLSHCISRAPDAVPLPSLVIKAMAAGLIRAARVRTLAGREAELPDEVDELFDWMLCFRTGAAARLGAVERPSGPLAAPGKLTLDAAGEEDRERGLLLVAAAGLAAREGYWQLSGARISAAAGVSPRTFAAHFTDVESCFLAALEFLNDSVLALAAEEGSRASSWARGIDGSLRALAGHCARDPALAKLAFVEVYAPGREGLLQREKLIGRIARHFRVSAPSSQRPGELAAEASMGAIWGLVHHFVVTGRNAELPALAPFLSFLALAPAIGPAGAEELVDARTRTLVIEHES